MSHNHKINTTDSICLSNLMKREDFYIRCTEMCPSECDSLFFSYTNSFSLFPTNSFYTKLKMISPYITSLDANGSVQNKLLKVNVFFKKMNQKVYRESPGMTSTMLLAVLGGTFAMFLGLNAYTIFEIFELAIFYFSQLSLVAFLINYLERKRKDNIT